MNKSVVTLILAVALVAAAILVGVRVYNNSQDTDSARELITASLGEDRLEDDLVKAVTKDLQLLKKADMAYGIEELILGEDGTITYIIPIDEELRDEIKVREEANGDIVVDIQEGDLYNELTIPRVGETLLNGKPLFEE